MPLLKSTPVETTPPVATLPPNIVELEIEGVLEYVDVYEGLKAIDKEDYVPIIVPEEDIEQDSHTPSAKSGKKAKKGGKEIDFAKASTSRKSCKQEEDPSPNLPVPIFRVIEKYQMDEAAPMPNSYIRYIEKTLEELAETVEYDMDEVDFAWLEIINQKRGDQKAQPVSPEVMEFIIDRLEKESYFQMQSSGADQGPIIDDDAVCCICMDGECQNSNAILFCDMCNLAVHQDCYGVPYIPEGQWLCRRCYLSPSIAPECVLCPNKGGAFKQTECKRWAHVVCAIWIPEVCFANTVFLEPIDMISSIPPARWKLACFICKQKGAGACIQCYKSNCYTAFHVTCAQLAGLCMRMETVKLSSGIISVKKTAYCDPHAPPDFIAERDHGSPTARQKLKQIRKRLAENRCAPPVVSIPTIPPEQLVQLASAINVAKKKGFMKKVYAYWKLKRIDRSGVPLLRRLQISNNLKSSRKLELHRSESKKEFAEITRVRQDLEKSRLLCELTRKREKLKREDIYLNCQIWDMRIQPFNYFLASIVDDLVTKDTQSIFTQPVDPDHVPDYLTVVEKPMDLSTMRKKIFEFEYETIADLEKDFQLMIENCLLYNGSDTVFYRAALNMQVLGGVVFREAERKHKETGYEPSGIFTVNEPPEYKQLVKPLDEHKIVADVESTLDDRSRQSLSFEEHEKLLEDLLDKCLELSHATSRRKRFLRIKNEIIRLKRRQRQLENGEAVGNVTGDSSVEEEDEVGPASTSVQDSEDSSEATEDEELGVRSMSRPSSSNILRRLRLRSTDKEPQQQAIRVTRRLSKSADAPNTTLGVSESTYEDEKAATANNLPVVDTRDTVHGDRPRRGRPPKSLSRGRGRPRLDTTGPPRGIISALKTRRLAIGGRGGLRGRPRLRKAVRPIRRSMRVEQLLQQQQTTPDKEAEVRHPSPNSRQGSPVGRNLSPRLNRNPSPGSPKRSLPTTSSQESLAHNQRKRACQPSPILGSPLKPHEVELLKMYPPLAALRGEAGAPMGARERQARAIAMNLMRSKLVVSSRSMEATAKSVVCEERRFDKGKLVVAKGSKLKRPTEPVSDGSAQKKTSRGVLSAGRGSTRNSAGKNLVKSPVKQRTLPQRKTVGPAAAVGKRKKNVAGEVEANGPMIGDKSNEQAFPLTNGLPLIRSPTKVGSPLKPSKLGVPNKAMSPKRRTKVGGNVANSAAATLSTGNVHNPVISPMYQSSLHMKKPDSFFVYRSGGDHDINSFSEQESEGEEDEEEMEEEEGDEDDDDDEVDEEEEESESEEEQEEPSTTQDSQEAENDQEEEGDEDDEDEDESSESDNSSDSDSSTSSSSLYSGSESSNASSSTSSSSITNPKHFSPTRVRKRRTSKFKQSLIAAQLAQGTGIGPASGPVLSVRTVRSQLASPTISSTSNNNNNILCNNKEWEKDGHNLICSDEDEDEVEASSQGSSGGGREQQLSNK